jgi:tripartite-type tricarboxylate transporter receptor subunit TctC
MSTPVAVSACRGFLIGAVAAASMHTACVAAAELDQFPAKPIRVIVPFSAGGPSDVVVRVIAPGFFDLSRQQLTIDNRPGANAIIGTELAAKAPPDGYTLAMFAFPHGVNPSMYPKLPYDTGRDFAPVTLVSSGPMLLTAHPSVPANNVRTLLDLARARPDELTCASSGNGSTAHLALELMNQMAHVKIRHVPYRGASQAATDVIGGHVSLYFGGAVSLLPHVKAGKLKALAVSTRKRSQAAPDVPTIDELGLTGYEVSGWYGVVVPARTPPEIVSTLNRLVTTVLRRPDVVNTLAAHGAEVIASTPEAFGAHMDAEIARWSKVVKAAGITSE